MNQNSFWKNQHTCLFISDPPQFNISPVFKIVITKTWIFIHSELFFVILKDLKRFEILTNLKRKY